MHRVLKMDSFSFALQLYLNWWHFVHALFFYWAGVLFFAVISMKKNSSVFYNYVIIIIVISLLHSSFVKARVSPLNQLAQMYTHINATPPLHQLVFENKELSYELFI